MTIRILGSAASTYTRAVCMACLEKGVSFELSEQKLGSVELRTIHPLGKMPAMVDGDFVLFESKAIMTYVDRRFDGPRLVPTDAGGAALVEQWISITNTWIDVILIRTFLMIYVRAMRAGQPPAAGELERVMPDVHQALDILESATNEGYLVAGTLTLADINLMPILHRVRGTPEGSASFAERASLTAYYDMLSTRPSFVATNPPDRPPGREEP